MIDIWLLNKRNNPAIPKLINDVQMRLIIIGIIDWGFSQMLDQIKIIAKIIKYAAIEFVILLIKWYLLLL